ncbi:unnamed protein product, partial [Rotaria sordida]
MGSSHSFAIPHFYANIRTSDGKTFTLSHRNFVDHIILLRRVIAHPEMTQQGETLNYFIEDYCRRMAHQAITTRYKQSRLPWEIDWIWHVHRLHPIAYNNDCIKQLPNGKLVDKRYQRLKIKQHRKHRSVALSKSIKKPSTFVPSIDLVNAVLRQRDFLEKFKQHYLFSMNLRQMNQNSFAQMVQNYVLFLKLAKKDEIIVPTFDIDLIWHTHMRFPSFYQKASIVLCGFLLDHDDSLENDTLVDAYQKTAEQWKMAYKVDYGKNIDNDNLRTSQYVSSCAMIVAPIVIYSSDGGGGGCGG